MTDDLAFLFAKSTPSSHAFWGMDPSGYCTCDGCNTEEEA